MLYWQRWRRRRRHRSNSFHFPVSKYWIRQDELIRCPCFRTCIFMMSPGSVHIQTSRTNKLCESIRARSNNASTRRGSLRQQDRRR